MMYTNRLAIAAQHLVKIATWPLREVIVDLDDEHPNRCQLVVTVEVNTAIDSDELEALTPAERAALTTNELRLTTVHLFLHAPGTDLTISYTRHAVHEWPGQPDAVDAWHSVLSTMVDYVMTTTGRLDPLTLAAALQRLDRFADTKTPA